MRAAKQEFSVVSGGVAGRDIHHHHALGRLLTRAERAELNNVVRQIEQEFGEPAWRTWKFLHRTIGIDNIDAMRLDHRDQAETILQLLQDRAAQQQALKQFSAASDTPVAGLASAQTPTPAPAPGDDIAQRLAQMEKAHSSLEKRLARANSVVVGVRAIRRKLTLARYFGVISLLLISALLYLSVSFYGKLATAQALDGVCRLNDEVFHIGARLDQKNAVDLECVKSADGHSAQWRHAETLALIKK